MSATNRIRTFGWTAVTGNKFVLPLSLNGPLAEDRVQPDHETPLNYNYIGELINESEIVSKGKGSAEFSIKGHHSEKDGIAPGLLAAEEVAAHSASFDGSVATDGRLQ